jgi:hypothetical protein
VRPERPSVGRTANGRARKKGAAISFVVEIRNQMRTPEVEALERFVTDNDDLLELEERVGRFNIFDALRIERAEIRHSNFLAWLLDPAESHGLGSLFLRSFLMDLLKKDCREDRPIGPVDLDGVELQGVEIRREWRNIDLLIVSRHPSLVITIENKVESREHGNQLSQYEDVVRREFSGVPESCRVFVFLTKDQINPSAEGWFPYSYAELYRVLNRCRTMNRAALGGDVAAFLDHYLRLIGNRFMPNSEIEELCRKIYRNHRQAIELIFEHAGVSSSGLVADVRELIEQDGDRWQIVGTTSSRVNFVPRCWGGRLPAIGSRSTFDPSSWLVLSIEVKEDGCRFAVRAWPTTDAALRRRVIDRLTEDKSEFGLRLFSRKILGDRWTVLAKELILSWHSEDEPEGAPVIAAAAGKLAEVFERLKGVPEKLRDILESAPVANAPPSAPTE